MPHSFRSAKKHILWAADPGIVALSIFSFISVATQDAHLGKAALHLHSSPSCPLPSPVTFLYSVHGFIPVCFRYQASSLWFLHQILFTIAIRLEAATYSLYPGHLFRIIINNTKSTEDGQ